MVHMERDKGYRAGGAILDEISEQTEAVFAAAKFNGRRNGKTAAWAGRQVNEVDERVAYARAQVAKARLDRRQQRRDDALYRRRYEFPPEHAAGVRTGGARAKVTCPHMIARHYDEAHPRYGDRFPITRTVLRRVKGAHYCVPGVAA